jgi:Flp pilus assembly protein TadD
MNDYATQDLRLKKIILVAALGLLVAACQPSAENRLLLESGMTMEDAKFYPSDEYIRMAKVNFRNGDYGLAEGNYRKAVEVTPKDAEAWLGLAASYDRLRRFDLADRAYEKVLQLGYNNAAVLNNTGYSQLLRGDLKNARRFLLKAYELEPENPYIVNNIALLGQSEKSVKRVDL